MTNKTEGRNGEKCATQSNSNTNTHTVSEQWAAGISIGETAGLELLERLDAAVNRGDMTDEDMDALLRNEISRSLSRVVQAMNDFGAEMGEHDE